MFNYLLSQTSCNLQKSVVVKKALYFKTVYPIVQSPCPITLNTVPQELINFPVTATYIREPHPELKMTFLLLGCTLWNSFITFLVPMDTK